MSILGSLISRFNNSNHTRDVIPEWNTYVEGSNPVREWMISENPPTYEEYEARYREHRGKTPEWNAMSDQERDEQCRVHCMGEYKKAVIEERNPQHIDLYEQFLEEAIKDGGLVVDNEVVKSALSNVARHGASDARFEVLERLGFPKIINEPLKVQNYRVDGKYNSFHVEPTEHNAMDIAQYENRYRENRGNERRFEAWGGVPLNPVLPRDFYPNPERHPDI